MAWELEFYRTASGRAPVEDYLDELTAPEAAKAARGLDVLRTFGTRLGMPHVRPLRGGIYELRLHGQREHRVLYVGVVGQRFLLLHAFTKKTQRTPQVEITLAEQRHQDYPPGRGNRMDDLDRYIERRKTRDAGFREAWEEGRTDLDFRKAVIGARLSAGLSQKQLAEQIGTSQAAVARMEAGTYRPRIETLHRLAAALHVTFEVDSAGVRVRPAA